MVNKEFVKNCDVLKNEYIKIKQRVNSVTYTGQQLEDYLLREIEKFEPRRFEIMSLLGELSFNLNADKKKIYQQEVKKLGIVNMFKEAPYYKNIITKENGYAGDSSLMQMIYKNSFEGATPFGKFLHKQAVLCQACQAVRNRKEFIKNEILKKQGNIYSLGAGPASEMSDILKTGRNNYKFHALDHDIKTLKATKNAIKDPRLTYSIANALKIMRGQYLILTPRMRWIDQCDPQNDFKGASRLSAVFKYKFSRLKAHYDLGFSIGLPDYIRNDTDRNKGITGLTEALFKLIKPGGSLIMGNFSDKNPLDIRFVMEFICDWNLIYRSKKELFDFSRTIPKEEVKSVQVLEEETGINIFLKIDKK